jgi:ferredoxin
MPYFRVNEKCNGCLSCVENCPASALGYLDQDDQRTLQHNMTKCARCGQCWRICPQEAIEFQHLLVGQWDDVVTLDLIRCRVCGEALYSPAYQEKLENELSSSDDFARSTGNGRLPPGCRPSELGERVQNWGTNDCRRFKTAGRNCFSDKRI